MKAIKKKTAYKSPTLRELQTDLEGLVCSSVLYAPVEVDELHNINADSESATQESLYFEF